MFRKTKKISYFGIGKSLQGPKIQINQKIHQTWDVFRWILVTNAGRCSHLPQFPGKSHQDNYYSFDRIFSREIPEIPIWTIHFPLFIGRNIPSHWRRRRCVPSLCIGDVMALHQAGISGRKRDVLLMLPGTKAGELVDIWLKWYRMSLSYCKSFLPRFEVCDFCFQCFGTVCFVEDGFFVREMTVPRYQFHSFKGSWNPSSRGRWSLANLLPKLNHDHSSRWACFTLSSQFFHDSSAFKSPPGLKKNDWQEIPRRQFNSNIHGKSSPFFNWVVGLSSFGFGLS